MAESKCWTLTILFTGAFLILATAGFMKRREIEASQPFVQSTVLFMYFILMAQFYLANRYPPLGLGDAELPCWFNLIMQIFN